MRKTQILKLNHHSKNGVTIDVDTDTALLNADKNSKTIKNKTTTVYRTKLIISSEREERSICT